MRKFNVFLFHIKLIFNNNNNKILIFKVQKYKCKKNYLYIFKLYISIIYSFLFAPVVLKKLHQFKP